MIYNIDYKKLGILFLPISLRRISLIAFVHSLLAPLISIHYDFNLKRKEDLYKLQHNGQICFLRKVLNDRFDPTLRRIKINEGNRYDRQYIYTDAEYRPKFLGLMYLREDSDYSDTGVDFIVSVPVETYNQYEMPALIDFYRLASKRYKIEKT